MKSWAVQLIIVLIVLIWMELNHWYTAVLCLSVFVIIICEIAHNDTIRSLNSALNEQWGYMRARHAAQMLLGSIRARIADGEPVDVTSLVDYANSKAELTKKLDAHGGLLFSDNTALPAWEPTDSERAKHVLDLLYQAARNASNLPDNELSSSQIHDLRFSIREQFQRNNF